MSNDDEKYLLGKSPIFTPEVINDIHGKADPQVYIDNPFGKKIRDKDTMQKYLDADEKLSNTSLKIDYYDTMLVYLESILKVIQNRTFQIKNAIEFMRFNSGLG